MKEDKRPPRNPQSKKASSYAKDRRNDYGENHKASRKAIPRRKAGENRSDRRKIVQSLPGVLRLDEAAADVAESSARHDINRVGGWRKTPDIPLGKYLAQRGSRRGKGQPSGSDKDPV